jgi:GT2 family glycosyltransferase
MYGMHRGVDEIDVGQYDRKTDTDFISGCSMFFPEKVIRSVGFLNDNFFLYLEDLDYCLRARKLGFQLKYIPESKIWHINAGSTAKPGNELHAYYFTRNRLLIGIKYAPLRTKIALIREAISMLFKPDRIRRKAVMDALTGRKGRQYQWKIR